jgi:hypothetical protein
MSWHYLRAQEEESLQDICSGGELLPPLKSKTIHAEFYCNGKLMDSYLDSLSGTTYEHSMESLGKEKSMSSQAVFHAKTLVPQEKESDLTESDQDSGERWQGSFAKYDPATHSLRTPQCSLFEDSTEFCAILPKWGLMLDGELWEQQTLVHLIKGTESGLSPTPPPPDIWPTPTTRDYKGANGFETTKRKIADGQRAHMGQLPNVVQHLEQKPIGGTLNPAWVEWLMGWPIGFTDLKPLVTGRWPFVPQQHGKYSVKESND